MELADFLSYYISREHRDNPGQGCTMAALCADAARQPASVQAVFAAGIDAQVDRPALDDAQPGVDVSPDGRARRIALMAMAVGAVVLSRSCPDDAPLADEILDICRADVLARLAAR